jgi:transcriptional regulator with XRE-family HTH domain
VAKKPEAVEFGRRLQEQLIRKQWSQSDLARAAKKFVPEIERYHISHWVRGQHMPTPVNLDAIARALGVATTLLMPEEGATGAAPSPLFLRGLTDGRAELHIAMSMDTA